MLFINFAGEGEELKRVEHRTTKFFHKNDKWRYTGIFQNSSIEQKILMQYTCIFQNGDACSIPVRQIVEVFNLISHFIRLLYNSKDLLLISKPKYAVFLWSTTKKFQG